MSRLKILGCLALLSLAAYERTVVTGNSPFESLQGEVHNATPPDKLPE